MSGDQRGSCIRLWGGGQIPCTPSRPASVAGDRKTGKTGGVNVKLGTVRGKSAGRCGPQPPHNKRQVSSARLSRRNVTPPTPCRVRATTPHPQWLQSLPQNRGFSLQHPQGFNLQEYVRTQGSSKGIRIGRNGHISSDKYFGRYLEECALNEDGPDSTEEGEDGEREGEREQDARMGNKIEPRIQPAILNIVPLCWEDQLKKTKPEKIFSTKKNVLQKRNSSSQYLAVKLSSVKHLQELFGRVSVSITWRQIPILQKTLLRRLSVPTSSSQKQKVCVIPRVDLEEEEKKIDNKLEVTDLEVTPLDDVLVKGDTSSKPEDLGKYLCIYFHCTNSSMLKTFSSLSFEVSLYPSNFQVFPPSSTPMSTVAKPRVLSDMECVLCIQLDMPKDPQRLAVACCVPRTPMFNIAVDVSTMTSVCEHEKRHVPDSVSKHTKNKEEDEDMTDLLALAEQFPDLNNMMELLNDYSTAPATPPSFPSPVHGVHLNSLNAMATNYRGKPLIPGEHAHPSGEKGVDIMVPGGTRWRNNVKELPRNLYRHSPRNAETKKPYTTIVSQQLRTYGGHI